MGGMWLMRFAPLIAAAQACASNAMRSQAAFTTFTEREAADFEAFAARIVPTDETPGAREAGAVYFADNVLGDFLSYLLPIVRPGLEAMNQRVAEAHPDTPFFADLTEAQQDEIIGAMETEPSPFFFFAKTLVMLSLASDPSYGGNRDQIGWRMIGFEPTYAYQPPFGYYDRDEHGTTASADGTPEGADR
jgi:gluconate 2-dehydrogenase gamma chain